MPIFELKCLKCGDIAEEWMKHTDTWQNCSLCGGERTRLVGGHFKLVYNNKTDMCTWGSEGYSSSQYWKKVKEARDRGENVKGINED
jgi:hypothetical protein